MNVLKNLVYRETKSKTIVRNTKKLNNLKVYNKRKGPKRTKKRANAAIRRARLMYRHLTAQKNVRVIMDNES